MMMRLVSYLLVLAAALAWFGLGADAQEGIRLTLNGVQYTSNSVVNITDIGTGSAALLCTTTYYPCCFSGPPPGTHWYFPNGSRIENTNTLPYYRTRIDGNPTFTPRRPGTVLLHRNPEGTTTGVFHCEILDASGDFQSIYVGIYTNTTGSPNVTSLEYDSSSRTFTCNSTGGPATTVTWRRDGAVITLNATHQQTKIVVDPVEGTYQTVLTIDSSVGQSDIPGLYCCTVENVRGSSSRAVVIPGDGAVVPPLDVIVSHNGDPFVAGLSYNLTCTVTVRNVGDPPTIEWFDPSNNPITTNSAITVGNTLLAYCSTYTATLHFTTLHTFHGGQYTCWATLGAVNNSEAVNITVQIPPLNVTIAIDQNSSIISTGTNFTLTCITELPPEVDTNVTLSTNWTGPAGDALPGSRSSLPMTGMLTRYQNTLIVHPVNADQFGNYSCTATVNSDPPSSFIAASEGSDTLTVIELLHNVTITSSGAPISGGTYNLTCTVEANVPPTVQWLYSSNGTAVTNGSNITVGTERTTDSTTILTLSFNPLHTSYGRQYTCQSTTDTPASTVNTTRNVTVQVANPLVTVSRNPPTGTLYVGGNVTLECLIRLDNTVDTSVTVAVVWSASDGMAVTNTSRHELSPVTGSFPTYHATLYIRNLMTNESGNYTCNATASPDPPSPFIVPVEGQSGMISITVELLHNVTIVDSGVPISGETYNLTCTVEANVPSTVQWLYSSNGTAVTNNSDITVETQRTTGSITTLTLSFNPLHTSHGGQYTCQSTTDTPASTVNATRNVTVQVANPLVTVSRNPPNVTLYVGGDVTLECLIRLDNTVDTSVTVAVVWSASNGVTITNASHYVLSPVTDSFPTYHATLDIRNLMMNDSGNYACNATASPDPPSPFIVPLEGQSGMINITVVPPPSAPTITIALSHSSTSINLTWTQPESRVVDSYELSFSYQGPCSGFNHTNTTTVNGTTRQYTLTGLQEFSNYTVTVVAVNGAGRSGGNSVNVVTRADAPGDPPTEVTAMATSPVSITIRWSPVPCINRNSNITGYTVRYSRGGGSTESVSVSGTGQSERTYTATLLVPSTSYSIQVAAVTSTGVTGPFSTTVNETTSPPESAIVLNGAIIPNHGFILLDSIGESNESLLCLTDFPACCRANYTDDKGHLGDWFFPNETMVPNMVLSMGDEWEFYRTRGRMMVFLHRRRGGVNGIYHCMVPDQSGDQLRLYVGVYTSNTGDVMVSSVQFQLTSELNAPIPTFTLTCTSTGGPATTVSWTVNNSAVTEDSAHNITSQVLTDAETGTYNHTLVVTGRLVGEYQCNVSNNKPSSSSGMLAVVDADHATGLTAELLPQKPDSFSVSWTPPSSSANLTGYHIYYSGADDSGSMDVGVSTTNITIDNRKLGVTYTITMVALSPHLPSPVIGPVTVTLPGTLGVTITHDTGVLTAGQLYNLTCTVTLDGVTGSPTIKWLDPNDNPLLNSTSVTVENMVMVNGSAYNRTLVFSSIHTSHGGQYTCQTTLDQASTMASTNISVQIPQPTVNITLNRTGDLYGGTPLTLTCSIQLNPAVDTTVMVTRMWRGPRSQVVSDTSRVTVSNVVERSDNLYKTTIEFRSLSTSDGGNYDCEATVTPDPQSQFVIMSTRGSDMHSVTVQVPPPSVRVTNSSGTYAGTNFNLTCTIELNTAVDTPVVVNSSTWYGPLGIPTGTRIIASEPTGTGAVYQITLMFRPLNTSDGGDYTCEATVSPSPESLFITASAPGSGTLFVAVQALPPPEVVITSDGSTTAGDVYTLTCNATVVGNLAVRPDIQWLYTNGTTVGGTNITVGTMMVVMGNRFTHNLTFFPLHTSHGGRYICRASVDIQVISFSGINSESSMDINVQIPINATISHRPPADVLSAGINLTLICTIQLNTAVDTNVMVNASWTGPAVFASNSQGRISVTSPTGSVPLYETRVFFSPLNSTDSGTYVCQADVRPDSSSPFITMNRDTATQPITVGGLVAPTVVIKSEGDPTAGSSYTLVCQVTVTQGLVVDPDVVWLDSSGMTVSGLMGRPSIEGNVVTRNLTFNPLHTTHGGVYTCHASISLPSISIANLSNNSSAIITVLIPQPTVSITPNRTGVLYAGTPLTLTCSIQLNPAVNTTVMVNRTWRGPGSQVVSNSSHVTVSNILQKSALIYTTTTEFVPLSTTDSGNYECEATVTPDPQSQFVNMSTKGSDTHPITVQDLPVPEVAIHDTGNTTAGEMYTLGCTATVVENLVVVPTIQWEYSNGSAVEGGSTFTLSAMVTSGNTTTRNLTFSPLRTSHGGKYTCKAIINIPSISISGLSTSQSTDVVIQIPAPTIHITTMQPTYNGTNVTLTCTIRLNTAVDTGVNVSGTWRNSTNVLTTSNTTSIMVSDTQGVDRFTYQSLLRFEPLKNHSMDGGSYVCEASVTPFSMPQYIRNISNNGSYILSVEALPLPFIQFTPSTFAMTGQSYSLTCTVQVVQYLAASPDVTWLAPGGRSLGNINGITMREAVENGNITTLRFTVDQLAESHTGNYTCRACISINKAAIEGHCGHVVAEVTLLVPGRVRELQFMSLSDHSVRVLWREPVNTNGAIVNYTIQVQRYRPVSGSKELELVAINPEFNRNMFTSLALSSDGRFMIMISEGLEPLIPYNVTVVAVNLAGPGEQKTTNFFTRQGAPSTAPSNVEVVRLNGTTMNVSWTPLNLVEARGFVQSYIITYQQPSSGSRRKRQMRTQQVDGSASSAIVGGLQPGVAYEVTVSGMTTENGPVSLPTTVQPERSSGSSGATIAGVVAGLVVAVIVIIIVVVIAYFLYKSQHKGGASIKTKEMFELTGKGRPEKSGSIRPLMSSMRKKKDEAADEEQTAGAVEESAPIPVLSTEVTDRMKPISVTSFRDHVQQMHAERDRGFEIEYQSLGSDPVASHEVSKLPFNRVKNRFANIFPYDYCRVKLTEIPGEEGSDYINASIMDGYNRKGPYIAAQGPMPNTTSDYWRMIWEKRLPNVVMLTKCMEAGRRKCEQYWGENIGDDFETPDNKLRITTTSVLPLADFDIRIFTVKSIENPDAEPLKVTQYHFTSWPDHGVPKFATSLIAFIRRVQKGHNKDDGYPLLVHCSAGVGRTGTFILLDSMLERMKAENTVNVYEFLHNMRTKRVLMVQTQAQYIFIHDALDELITCGETDISAAGLRVKVNRLRKVVPGKGITGFAEQFQLLDQVSRQPEEGDFSDAQEHYNREKNRYPDKLPYNMSRARLRPTAEEGSEYINASFVDGYRHRNAYIATQAPLKTTVNDFWRMIWEFKSKAIVMLCNMMEDNLETSYPYWPTKEEETIKYGKIVVTMQSKAAYGDFGVRKFNLREDKSQGSPTEGFQVTQFHHTEWPETGKPPAAGALIEMIDLLMKTQMNTGNRAITVMCNDGVGRTGTFICIHSQLERLKTEGVVDIFQSIKSARIQRAGLVPHDDQYAFCHEVLADYVDKFENYANFKEIV